MPDYKRDFIEFAIARDVLRFGKFTLKSGRVSPYFFNAGLFDSGACASRLGQFYANAIVASGIAFDVLFGPAYKGIPLATATAIALAERHDRDIPYAFNRKEAKDHGEGGMIVGAPLGGRILIIDDVISAGTSVRESVHLIRAAGAEPAGVVVALDRQERGQGPLSAIQEVEAEFQLPVVSIINLDNLLGYLKNSPGMEQVAASITSYRARYGTGADSSQGTPRQAD